MRPAPSKLNKEHFPFFLSVLVTLIIVFFLEHSITSVTKGAFMYPLDDPFIHMQVARNLSVHGVWGINPPEFGSASSSLLYTVLLALVFKLSSSVLIPFILNVVSGVWLLWVIHAWLLRQDVRATGRATILLLVIFLLPLPTLILTGMEHTIQCLFTFLFITQFAASLEKDRRLTPVVFLCAMGVVAVRYEGLFLVCIACLMLAYYRKWGAALLLGGVAILPVVVFGIYSLSKGSYFLPNSVLVKSEEIPLSLKGLGTFLNDVLVNKLTIVKQQPGAVGAPPPGISLLSTQRLLILLPLCMVAFLGALREKMSYYYMLLLLMGGTLLHLSFAATGWFYRYEAYLILSTVVLTSVLIYKYGAGLFRGQWKWAWAPALLLIFTLSFPLILRSSAAYSKARRACLNIYDQQYQMGQFLKRYYDNDVVAANDIGAIAYYTNARIVDLWGLGSIEVAKSRKMHYWTPSFLDSLVRAKDTRIAVVFDEWFDPALLHRWTKVATWQMPDNVICGSDIVCFYAIRPEDVAGIKNNLQAYQSSLPGEVHVQYYP
jgi:hypothetical protein